MRIQDQRSHDAWKAISALRQWDNLENCRHESVLEVSCLSCTSPAKDGDIDGRQHGVEIDVDGGCRRAKDNRNCSLQQGDVIRFCFELMRK